MLKNPQKQDFDTEHFEARIVRALERQPPIQLDADFAARVMAGMPRQSHRTLPQLTGRRFGMAALVLLLAGITAVAPASGGHSLLATTVEWSLCAEFLGIALWLGMTSSRSPR